MLSPYAKMLPVDRFFRDHGIAYVSEGKNVKKGYINVTCPLCGDDPSFHLAVNLTTKRFFCWRNGSHKGDLTRLVSVLIGTPLALADKLVIDYIRARGLARPKEKVVSKKPKKSEFKLPDYISNIYENRTAKVIKPYYLYLKRRGLYDKTIKRLDFRACYFGKYFGGIVIPIYSNGRIVNYVVRDATGKNEKRYRYCPKKTAIKSIAECLYLYDEVPIGVKDLIVVEGAFDTAKVFQEGFYCIGLFGNFAKGTAEVKDAQIKMIIKLKPDNVLVFLDRGSTREARNICSTLRGFVSNADYVKKVVYKDPAAMPPKAIIKTLKAYKIKPVWDA